MTTRINLLQLDGATTLNHYMNLARNFFNRSQPMVAVAKNAPTLPKRKGSAIAAVLAKLLSGAVLNSIDQADELGSSRLKDHISNLRKRHGWEAIQSFSVATATVDGRVQWVMQYWIPAWKLELHTNEQSRIWIDQVRSIRATKRADFKGAERRATRCNSRKLNKRIELLEARILGKRGEHD